MDEEEKKAIDNMKSLLLYSIEHEYFSPFQEQEIDDMNIVLNFIEKQSKEIEELKVVNQMQKYRIEVMDERELISRDKVEKTIKVKIEEYEEKFKAQNGKKTINYHLYRIIIDEVLKPLLDKIKGDDK